MSTTNRWAIAIHGGAGGDPKKWGDQKCNSRLAGLNTALDIGRQMLTRGSAAIEVVEAVVRSLENDGNFNAGRGSFVADDADVEMDASIMNGATLACGAIAAAQTARNPITAAARVMTSTPHVLLVGHGADRFIRDCSLDQVTADYFRRPQRNTRPSLERSDDSDESPRHGTVGCAALDAHGDLAAGTSTGGSRDKLPGRAGDSPVIGAGTFAANGQCAVSCTGLGEQFMRHLVAYDIAAQIRYAGRGLAEAVQEVVRHRLDRGDGGVIAVSPTGEIVVDHNSPGMCYGQADSFGNFNTGLKLPNAPT